MKILFSMRHLGFARLFEPVVRGLAERGHAVVVVADRRQGTALPEPAASIARDHPSIVWDHEFPLTPSVWSGLATAVRLWLDYLRFLEAPYRETPKLRQRAEEQVPVALVRITRLPIFRLAIARRLLRGGLTAIERTMPTNPGAEQYLRERDPDLVLFTPLVYIGSNQVELLKAAKAVGQRTGLAVGSWDHLSSKALIRDVPDRVFVWNNTQEREAVDLHGVPADRIVVTGAQCYDQWFDRTPSRPREEFCRSVGLPADRPFVLYVCSALFVGSPIEADFVVSWIGRLRSSQDERLRHAGILVRPHPARLAEWEPIDLSGIPGVVVWGSTPVDVQSKADYFDSLYHSAAVVGLNTSAFLEAAIAGKPVLTITLAEFEENQGGTLHFRYLVDGELLRVAGSLEVHAAQLADVLDGDSGHDGNVAFVESFIRPFGRHVASTPRFLDAVERLIAEVEPAAATDSRLSRAFRPLLLPLALLTRWTLGTEERMLAADRLAREELKVKAREALAQQELERKRALEERSRREREEKIRKSQARKEAHQREREVARETAARQKVEHRRAKERAKQRRRREKTTRVRRERFRDAIARRLGVLFARTRG